MICGYCGATGRVNDQHGDEHDGCPYCCGSGKAACQECGADAEFVDDDGDYTCGECWQESFMEDVVGDGLDPWPHNR